jgi:hypothetical protein
MVNLDIIIVNWNTGSQLRDCLQSISLASPASVLRLRQCVVVDNASADGSAFDLEHKWSSLDLHVERLPKNMGFAVANNVGARIARGEWKTRRGWMAREMFTISVGWPGDATIIRLG